MTYTNRKSQLQRHTTTLLLAICGIFALTPMLSATEGLADVKFEALKLAVRDLAKTYPHEYTQGDQYLRELEKYEKLLPEISAGVKEGDSAAVEQIVALKRKILLDNPLLDFDRLLVIKRKPLGNPRRRTGDKDNDKGLGKFLGIPQQSSWQLHTMPNTTGWENEIAVLSPLKQDGKLKTLFTPENGSLINEMDLHFDAGKMMFSMPDKNKKWQIFEIDITGRNLRQLSPDDQLDVHNLDSCYLPNGNIAYISTAPFQGVPCNASVNVGMLYTMDPRRKNVRQVCFEQDHNFCPTVMPDGRILYLRWEYTDTPHVWARFLFTMNPDGTTQREYYGSGGSWRDRPKKAHQHL